MDLASGKDVGMDESGRCCRELLACFRRLEREFADFRGQMASMPSSPVKDFYSTNELADLLGIRAKTVRDYLREGRIHGVKKRMGRGTSKEWAISHQEYLRYQREGARLPSPEHGNQVSAPARDGGPRGPRPPALVARA